MTAASHYRIKAAPANSPNFGSLRIGDRFTWYYDGATYEKIGPKRYQLVKRDGSLYPGMTYRLNEQSRTPATEIIPKGDTP